MRYNKVHSKRSDKEKIIEGMNIVSEAVGSTMGAGGRTVVIEKDFGIPVVTKDGVTVAKSIKLKDELHRIGSRLIQETAIRTNDEAGDGTTTSTVLAQSIINESIKYMKKGSNPTLMKKGMMEAKDAIIKTIFLTKKELKTMDDVYNVAMISANGDEHVADLIREGVESVGYEGVLTVENSNSSKTYFELSEGFKIEKGYVSPYFATDPSTFEIEFEKPLFIFSNEKIENLKSIEKPISYCAKNNKPFVIVCSDISTDAITTAIKNKMNGTIRCAVVKVPMTEDNKYEYLKDISVMTGGSVIDETMEKSFSTFNADDFGEANFVRINKDETVILGAGGEEKKVENRVNGLKKLMDEESFNLKKEKFQRRIASFSEGIGVIYAGGDTEPEMKERKYRIEDALNATKSALAEGIVPGGGISYLSSYYDFHTDAFYYDDQSIGYNVVVNALLKPIKKIVENIDEEPALIIDKIYRRSMEVDENSDFVGYDVRKKKIVDNMFESGIIDPYKVVKNALINAVSIASTFISIDTAITIHDDSEKPNPMDIPDLG